MRTWLLLFPLLLASAGARAGVENLELLDVAEGEIFSLNALTPPVLGANGTAYWHAAIDYELGGSTLESDAGTLATDTRTQIEPGDWPLQGRPTDVFGSSVLLLGVYFPDIFQSTAALFSYPGFTRLLYYGSAFPGFTSDPTGLQVSSGLYDGDGSIVFGMRRATTFPNFTWTICRLDGAGITILAQSGVTAVPEAGGATFSLIRNPVVSGGVILFYGEGGGRRGAS